ncbi:MAG: LptF/LptG family permease, partial [Victivallales bacterium]|nr:LptF/LptG family permease [Victivallales bacterium]
VCTWLSLWVAPPLRNASEQLRHEPLAINPLTLLESGLASSISKSSNLNVRFGQMEDNGLLRNIHLTQLSDNGEILWDVTAATGIITTIPGTETTALVLKDFSISELSLAQTPARRQSDHDIPLPGFYSASSITIPLEFGDAEDTRSLKRKLKTMPLGMLLGDLAWTTSQENTDAKERGGTRHWLELQKRLALSFSPLAFLLLGIPFGIRNRRSETTSGLLICLVLALFFYLFMLWADGLANRPKYHPELIIWLPNLLYEIGGLVALFRISRH